LLLFNLRAAAALILLVVASLGVVHGFQARSPAWPPPVRKTPVKAPVLTAEEELKTFALPPGYRAQLVAKTDSPRALAAAAARLLAAAAPAMRRAGINAVVDVDPQSL